MAKRPTVDEFPYPIGRMEAQELIRVMAGLYRSEREAIAFTAPFGIDPLTITPNRDAISLWYELIEKLAIKGTVRATVQAARDQAPGNPRAAFLDALLADKPAPISAEPVPARNAGPGFDDDVTVDEARLFFDDLTMPVGRVGDLIATLQTLIAASPAVCLLRVENALASVYGTGFRIADKLILSNYHVLFPKTVIATKVQVDFGFEADASGKSMTVTSLAGAVSTIKGERADDWAVIEVEGMKPEWPILPLDASPGPPQVGEFAYILQHPGGQQKRLGFVRNTISDVDDRVVKYLTDTDQGSSGAPVLDAAGRLIALHHAGGRPIEVVGKPPVSKNEGIRISRVLERLRAGGIMG